MGLFADHIGRFGFHSLVIAASLVYFWGILGWKNIAPAIRFRLLSILGLFATAALMLLAIWPDIYSVPAIMSLPALFVFAVAVFWPAPIWKRFKLKIYLSLCVLVSGLSWISQICWELRR